MTDTPEAVRLAVLLSADPTKSPVSFAAAALLRRIPELEAEVQEQARLNGMGAERELALMAQVSRLEAERDQLRAELENVRVPEGWKLVPVEPTREMLDRGSHNVNCNYHYGTMETIAKHAYKAMLTAAPTPPAQAAVAARDASLAAIHCRLTRGGHIDSHTISTIVAECERALPALATHPQRQGGAAIAASGRQS